MSKKFYAINPKTGERWKSNGNNFLIMYDTGNLAVVTQEWYTEVTPLDTKIWKTEIKSNILPVRKITDNEILKAYGWTVECDSPFEIRHEDGSFASGHAAKMIVEYLKRGLE